MNAVNKTDFPGPKSQNYRRSSYAFSEEAHAAHQRAIGYAGSGEDQLLAGSKVLCFIDFIFVFDAHAGDAFFQFRLIDHQPPKHVAIQAADGCGRDDAFGGAP